MIIKWHPYPQLGTSVMPGRWLCTVRRPDGLRVELLDLAKGGVWLRNGKAVRRGSVVAIAHEPEVASSAVIAESYAARTTIQSAIDHGRSSGALRRPR